MSECLVRAGCYDFHGWRADGAGPCWRCMQEAEFISVRFHSGRLFGCSETEAVGVESFGFLAQPHPLTLYCRADRSGSTKSPAFQMHHSVGLSAFAMVEYTDYRKSS